MAIDLELIEEAYNKLRSYIYYDTTDILLRRNLVEFETNRRNTGLLSPIKGVPSRYSKRSDFKDGKPSQIVKQKLKIITEEVNKYHEDSSFFADLIRMIKVDFYPKNIAHSITDLNFITNKRVENVYKVDRITAFINAPIEIHLIAVLWIMQFGSKDDALLSDDCYGNRLVLTKEKDKVTRGSGLFKPYFKQYQNWRDKSVATARAILSEGKSALFLNLDIKDYFHSVRIPVSDILNEEERHYTVEEINIKKIFLEAHLYYTKLVGEEYCVPHQFYNKLKQKEGSPIEIVLPIGLVSSYVLGNIYLKDFDLRITQKVKPAYYGRYVIY